MRFVVTLDHPNYYSNVVVLKKILLQFITYVKVIPVTTSCDNVKLCMQKVNVRKYVFQNGLTQVGCKLQVTLWIIQVQRQVEEDN